MEPTNTAVTEATAHPMFPFLGTSVLGTGMLTADMLMVMRMHLRVLRVSLGGHLMVFLGRHLRISWRRYLGIPLVGHLLHPIGFSARVLIVRVAHGLLYGVQ